MSKVVADRNGYPRFVQISTRWMDNDVYGHVNNVLYYSFFDTAVNQILIEAGVLSPSSSPIIGLVAETSCRYHTSLSFPDTVVAGVRVAHLGTSSVRYELALFRNRDFAAAAEGYFVHVHVDRATGRPVAIPPSTREFLESLNLTVAQRPG